MVTDESLLQWYRKGFRDELYGSSTVESDYPIEMTAYSLGANHADLKRNNDSTMESLSDVEILKLIKATKTIYKLKEQSISVIKLSDRIRPAFIKETSIFIEVSEKEFSDELSLYEAGLPPINIELSKEIVNLLTMIHSETHK